MRLDGHFGDGDRFAYQIPGGRGRCRCSMAWLPGPPSVSSRSQSSEAPLEPAGSSRTVPLVLRRDISSAGHER